MRMNKVVVNDETFVSLREVRDAIGSALGFKKPGRVATNGHVKKAVSVSEAPKTEIAPPRIEAVAAPRKRGRPAKKKETAEVPF